MGEQEGPEAGTAFCQNWGPDRAVKRTAESVHMMAKQEAAKKARIVSMLVPHQQLPQAPAQGLQRAPPS